MRSTVGGEIRGIRIENIEEYCRFGNKYEDEGK